MTLDEAIKHCLEVAEQKERDSAELIDILDELDVDACKECAADHRQLAEWLTELKEAKRLLVYAVEHINKTLPENMRCEECAMWDLNTKICIGDEDKQCEEEAKWRYADEALKLIGGSENG